MSGQTEHPLAGKWLVAVLQLFGPSGVGVTLMLSQAIAMDEPQTGSVTKRLPVVSGAVTPVANGRNLKPGQFAEALGYPAAATSDSPIGGFLLKTLSLLSQGRVFRYIVHHGSRPPGCGSRRAICCREPAGFTCRRSP